MLESHFPRSGVSGRFSDRRLEGAVEKFVETLVSEGYAHTTIRRYLWALEHFGRWLTAQRIELSEACASTVERCIADLKDSTNRSRPRVQFHDTRPALRAFGAFLRNTGVVEAREANLPLSPAEEFCVSFDTYLQRLAGLAVGTRKIYLRYARAFFVDLFGDSAPSWRTVVAADVSAFVTNQAAQLRRSSCRSPVKATRAVLRFLVHEGLVPKGIEDAVPTVRQWKHAALPRHISAKEVEKVLSGCEDGSSVGIRDRAILLLLARLGLRAQEVRLLRLDDLDWASGSLLIRAEKSLLQRVLPLPHDAGEAIAEYLKNHRPKSSSRVVFLTSVPPFRPLTSTSTISAMVSRRLKRAHVSLDRFGAHTFRHTVATQMVRQGATFKEVADVLGHARLETTMIYAKLDAETLAGVALPWQGGGR